MGATVEQVAILADQQIALAAVDRDLGIVEQLRQLFTDQVWVVLGMVALGMVIGIAFAGAARLLKFRLDDDLPKREFDRRILRLKQIAFVSSWVWTTAILFLLIEASAWVKLMMSVGLGPVAGIGTPYMFDFLKWVVLTVAPTVGNWILERIKELIGKSGK